MDVCKRRTLRTRSRHVAQFLAGFQYFWCANKSETRDASALSTRHYDQRSGRSSKKNVFRKAWRSEDQETWYVTLKKK